MLRNTVGDFGFPSILCFGIRVNLYGSEQLLCKRRSLLNGQLPRSPGDFFIQSRHRALRFEKRKVYAGMSKGVLTERETDEFSIDRFWRLQSAHCPDPDELERLIAGPGLAPEWKARLSGRLAWPREAGPSS